MDKQKIGVTFMCENIKEFEKFLEEVFGMMSKNKIPSLAYKFNKKGKKQYDLSFPSMKEEEHPTKEDVVGVNHPAELGEI